MPRSPLTVEVKNSAGVPVSGAFVSVFTRHSGAFATIYNAETAGSTISNPGTTDAAGRFTFWADRGDYRADIAGTGITSYSIPLNAAAAAAGTMASPWVQTGQLPSASSYGKSIISATESTSSVSYTTLTTPDNVSGIVLPFGGIIGIMYSAIWQNSVANAARAAIFLGSNQLKSPALTTPVVQEATGGATVTDDDALTTVPYGLNLLSGAGATTHITTGETVGQVSSGSICWVMAAPATYAVSVRFRATSGSVTVKNRRLWVFAQSFFGE